MRKFIWFIAAVFVLSACTTEEYYTEYTELNVYSKVFTVNNNMWEVSSDESGQYLYCIFNESLLTQSVINDGMLAGYFYYALTNNGVKTSYLSPLPFSDFWVDKDGYKWEEHFTVDFSPGEITFIVKYDDHADEYPHYSAYEFVVKFTY